MPQEQAFQRVPGQFEHVHVIFCRLPLSRAIDLKAKCPISWFFSCHRFQISHRIYSRDPAETMSYPMWKHTGSPCPPNTWQKLTPVTPGRPLRSAAKTRQKDQSTSWMIWPWQRTWERDVGLDEGGVGTGISNHCFSISTNNGVDKLHLTSSSLRNNFAQSAALASFTSLMSISRARSTQKPKKGSWNTVGMNYYKL